MWETASLITMQKIFNSNSVSTLLPPIEGPNQGALLLSILEHNLSDKGFEVDITTPDLRQNFDCNELCDLIDELLEESIEGIDIKKRIKIYHTSKANFAIEFY